MWCKCEQQRSSKVIVALRAMRTCLQQILPSWWGIALHYSNYTPHRSRQHWSTYSKNRKLINTHLRIERSFKSPPPSHIYLETHMYGYIGGHCMQNTFTTPILHPETHKHKTEPTNYFPCCSGRLCSHSLRRQQLKLLSKCKLCRTVDN